MYSDYALKLYALKRLGIIKSNANFWREFNNKSILDAYNVDLTIYKNELEQKDISLTCVFDKEFLKLDFKVKDSENPYLFAYKGNVGLLNDTNNVAVIGTTKPTKDIEKREEKIVEELLKSGANVVSGLARGIDTVAHKTCIKQNGKTIAILPTTLNKIYPKENEQLASDIILNNGLVLTEYVNEPKSKFECIKRFIERDRLQAMLSSGVLLISSFAYKMGDSGSRHAMKKAKEYNKKRFVMYDEKLDKNNMMFGLNLQELQNGAKVITSKDIKEMF